jgi:hypothetical protein
MEDDRLWQAHFVTLAHLHQEMRLSLDVAQQHQKALAATQFLALETPHVIVEQLTPDIIEDVIDNLMALGVFESVFAHFDEGDNHRTKRPGPKTFRKKLQH